MSSQAGCPLRLGSADSFAFRIPGASRWIRTMKGAEVSLSCEEARRGEVHTRNRDCSPGSNSCVSTGQARSAENHQETVKCITEVFST